jgi:hypothetical protein
MERFLAFNSELKSEIYEVKILKFNRKNYEKFKLKIRRKYLKNVVQNDEKKKMWSFKNNKDLISNCLMMKNFVDLL